MNIGIYAPNWIGDAVLSLAFVNRCRIDFPQAHITIIAKTWVAAVFEHYPAVDEIIALPGSQLRGFAATTRTGLQFRETGLDQIYLLSDSLRSAYVAWLARSKQRTGFRGQFRAPFLTASIRPPKAIMHRSDRYLLLTGSSAHRKSASPGISLTDQERAWASDQLAGLGMTRPLAVFASSSAESRRVPVEKWMGFLRPFQAEGRELLFIGSSRERSLSELLIENLGAPAPITVCGDYGLRQSIALISQCDGAVAADSGLGHIAANLGLKTISLFGAGDPQITRPIGPRARVVFQSVHCSPCQKNVCHNRDEPLLCLSAISGAAVWEAYHALLGS